MHGTLALSARRYFVLGFLAQATLCFAGSLAAYLGGVPEFIKMSRFDLGLHFLMIGGLAFFLDGALAHRPLTRFAAHPRLAPFLVLTVAGIEELAQSLSPLRSCDWTDYAADAFGVLFFSWLSKRIANGSRAARERSEV
jgi:hypothetical protein